MRYLGIGATILLALSLTQAAAEQKGQGSKQFAPGQQSGAAKDAAPGQRQSYPGEAKKFAPGQQGKKITKKKKTKKKTK
jgi:hypothetical protein